MYVINYTFLGAVFENFGHNLGHSQNEIHTGTGAATPQVLNMWPWTSKIEWKKVKTQLSLAPQNGFWHNITLLRLS